MLQHAFGSALRHCFALAFATAALTVGCEGPQSSAPDRAPGISSSTQAVGVAGVPGTYRGMARPATVPQHFVPTPNGWFDPACVIGIGKGEKVLADGRVARMDGTIAREALACASPHYDVQGRIISEQPTSGVGQPVGQNTGGWIAWADSKNTGALSYYSANLTVPAGPSHPGAIFSPPEIIYLFTGLVPQQGSNILQPVLGWNTVFSGIPGWSISSWNCCLLGTIHHSDFLAVDAGDVIFGEMKGSSCTPSTGVCGDWDITTRCLSGEEVSLHALLGLKMNWVFGAVLEDYNTLYCGQLPAGAQAVASDFTLRASGGATLSTPTWNQNFSTVPQASCDYTITPADSPTAHSVTLGWNPCWDSVSCDGLCGTRTNACGVVVACGDNCPAPQTCGGAGVPNHCGINQICAPNAVRTCCGFAGGCKCAGEQSCSSDGSHWGPCEGDVPRGSKTDCL